MSSIPPGFIGQHRRSCAHPLVPSLRVEGERHGTKGEHLGELILAVNLSGRMTTPTMVRLAALAPPESPMAGLC
jgi:hypothetical protein